MSGPAEQARNVIDRRNRIFYAFSALFDELAGDDLFELVVDIPCARLVEHKAKRLSCSSCSTILAEEIRDS